MAREDLVRIVQKARKVERLTLELEQAREELRQAIVVAHEHGETISEIARRLGVSRQRVYQLLR
jgi:DNA-directed RNA polymerase specialized sigma24 family protein